MDEESEGPIDIVLPVVGGVPQPLLAIYATRLAHLAERLLLQGCAGPRFLLEEPGVRVRRLDEEVLRAVDPDLRSFHAANTPEEWQAVLALAAGDRHAG